MARTPTDRELYEEKRAVLERIKAHFALWETDKRMRTMGAIVLRDIERFEKEEAERTLREGR